MIPVAKPSITFRDILAINRALLKNEISGNSKYSIPIFEDRFATKIGMPFGVATNSGTSAIHAALSALDVGPGVKVAVSSYTNMATIFPIIQLGAEVIPVDIDPVTYNMDPSDLEIVLKDGARIILVVHIFGHPAPIDEILVLSKKYGATLIEDCAEAHGATINGDTVGTFGELSCFSFYANKLITTGEGGMVLARDSSMAERVRAFCSLGYGNDDKFLHELIGSNFRLSNLLASIGIEQTKRLEKNIMAKNYVAFQYNELFGSNPKIIVPYVKENCTSTFWVYAIRIKGFAISDTKELINKMRQLGVECREGFVPFTKQIKIIKKLGITPRPNPVAERLYESILYLPSGPRIKRTAVSNVATKLQETLERISSY